MRRIQRIVLAVLFFSGAAAALYPQAITLSSEDMRAAEERYKMFVPARFVIHQENMNSMMPGPNGVRGYTVQIPETRGAVQEQGAFKTDGEREVHSAYCRAAGIVLAREVSSESILSTKKDMIFTLYQFQVVDVLKNLAGAQIGSQITGMRFGGEVTDNGEALRVRVSGEAPFVAGATYLLVLDREGQNLSTFFFIPTLETIHVDHDRIFPANGSWGPFTSGQRLETVRTKLSELQTRIPCN